MIHRVSYILYVRSNKMISYAGAIQLSYNDKQWWVNIMAYFLCLQNFSKLKFDCDKMFIKKKWYTYLPSVNVIKMQR